MTVAPLDWGDGDYARTAATLAPVAEALVDFAGVREGQEVLDVACGTGNAAVAAQARGASVTGVDAAAGLLEQAAARAPGARWLQGHADSLPVADSGFDIALSAMGVIFAPDPAAAVAEMVRAVRPGGLLALTSWKPSGPINKAGGLLLAALDLPAGKPREWGKPEWATATLKAAGATGVRIEEAEIAFTAASPGVWWQEQAEHHPVWLWARRQLGEERWRDLSAEGTAALADQNEDPDAFRTTSGYLLVAASR